MRITIEKFKELQLQLIFTYLLFYRVHEFSQNLQTDSVGYCMTLKHSLRFIVISIHRVIYNFIQIILKRNADTFNNKDLLDPG